MLKKKSFVQKTKRGGIANVVREHYLRDDISCGFRQCLRCSHASSVSTLSDDAQLVIIPDTNIALHQIDVLDHVSIKDVVILQTVLDETKHRSPAIYHRLRAITADPNRHFYVFSNEHHRETYVTNEDPVDDIPIAEELTIDEKLPSANDLNPPSETPNDRNDRAIRVATEWYAKHLQELGVKVLLLTDDRGNREKATAMGLTALSMHDFVRTLFPALGDRVRASDVSDTMSTTSTNATSHDGYEQYVSQEAAETGIASGKYLKGTVRCYRDSCFDARLSGAFVDGQSVRIHGRTRMNRAFDGDIVAVQLVAPAVVNENPNEETDPMFEIDNVGKKKQSATKEAKVVAILRRNLRQFCGYLIDGGLFQPLDARVPRIKIKTQQQRNNELVNQLLVVAVDTWPIESRNPLGHYVQTIGAVGDLAAENEAILREHEVPFTPFPTAALSCLPAEDWCITQDEINKRTDVRSRRVCSIDPPGCKDIDDALHVQLVAVPKKWTISKATIPTPSPGTSSFAEYDFRTVRMIEKAEDAREDEDVYYEVGVHIADVSHFVAPGSALDDEASRRCTTVYLVDRRIDMLPSVLTEHLCSLNANVERLAFSVLWYLHCDSLVIQHAYYCKSVIRSRAALTYGEAQSLLDGKPLKDEFTNPHANKGQKPADLDLVHLTQDVRTMVRLGRHLKALRFDAGALALASAEVKFTDGDMSLYTLYETNSTVEELMLLANVSVAAKTAESFPAHAILRRHPPPEPHAFDRLVSIAQAEPLNYSWFDASTSKALNESLDRVPDAAVQRLLRMLATRCMQQALYMAAGSVKRDEWRHYGLAADVYTHFTSPIRRYADVMVHRLLAAALELVPLTAVLRGKDDVVEIVDNMNKRHLMAQLAGRASTDLHTVLFFKEKGEVVAEGVVMGVAEKGEWANVFVERYGLEGRVEEGATGAKVFERRKVRIQPGGRKLKIEWVASDNNVTAAAAAAESTTVGVTATTTEIRPPSAKKARRS